MLLRGARRFVFAVRAAEPAARAALALKQLVDCARHVARTRLGGCDRHHPADPLVARQRSQALPRSQCWRRGAQRDAEVSRKPVRRPARDRPLQRDAAHQTLLHWQTNRSPI